MPDTQKDGLERRLARLEENSWFQEESQKALNEQMQSQQKQLDGLEREISALRHQVERLRDIAGAFSGLAAMHEEDPPPHYQSRDWHE